MKMIYHSLFNCHLMYGLLLWGPSTPASNVNKLIKLQKRAVRIVNNSPYNATTNPIYLKLSIVKLADLIDIEIVKFMYHFSKGALPKPLLDFLTPNSSIHNYNTRNRQAARTMSIKFAPLKNSFLGKGPSSWVNLAEHFKQKPTIKSFIKALKQNRFDSYRDT